MEHTLRRLRLDIKRTWMYPIIRDLALGIQPLRDEWNPRTKRTHLENRTGKSLLMSLRPMREHATMHGDACSIFHLE